MDIPTAYAFFGQDPERTLQRISTTVKNMVADWNREFSTTLTVCSDSWCLVSHCNLVSNLLDWCCFFVFSVERARHLHQLHHPSRAHLRKIKGIDWITGSTKKRAGDILDCPQLDQLEFRQRGDPQRGPEFQADDIQRRFRPAETFKHSLWEREKSSLFWKLNPRRRQLFFRQEWPQHSLSCPGILTFGYNVCRPIHARVEDSIRKRYQAESGQSCLSEPSAKWTPTPSWGLWETGETFVPAIFNRSSARIWLSISIFAHASPSLDQPGIQFCWIKPDQSIFVALLWGAIRMPIQQRATFEPASTSPAAAAYTTAASSSDVRLAS